jgi:hypothetical protein
MEKFKEDFKIYCETVEDTKGLEILKQNLFDKMLNLETFMDDYIKIDLSKASSKEILNEAYELSSTLKRIAENASYIESFELREIYNLIPNYNYEYLKDVFDIVIDESYITLYKKIYPNENSIYKYEIDKNDLEKWYIDLFILLDKYNMI